MGLGVDEEGDTVPHLLPGGEHGGGVEVGACDGGRLDQ